MKLVFVSLFLLGSLPLFGIAHKELEAVSSSREGYVFIGCRPSPSECRYSCPSTGFLTQYDPTLCNPELEYYDQLACYCKTDQPN